MSRFRFILLGALIWLATPGLSLVAHAQATGPTVHIHAVDPPQSVTPETGGLPGLFLRATFSLLDPNGTIMTSEIENATLRLGGDLYSSKFSKLETDWSVVLLVDTSGTMNVGSGFTDSRGIRDSLIRALENAPDSASFALIPFSDRAPTAVEFTADREKLGNAIKALRPQGGRQACLNDGLYEAIAKLGNAPGRRAVFAVTASADSCATRSTQNVVDFANQNEVELYAVGIDGYTTTARELEAFTQPTGGLSEMRGISELSFALDNLMDVLGNQWQAVWVVYPSEGPQTAEVSLKLPDGTVVAGPLAFDSDRNYTRPPTVAVAGTAQSTLGGVRFNLDIINPDRIDAVDIDLVSKLTGRSVYQERLTELTDSILLPSDELVEDGEYTLTLTALDDQGSVLSQTVPLEFRFEPLQPGLTATVQEWPAPESLFFVISAAVQNLEGVAGYRMWLEQGQGSAPVRGTEVTVPAGETLRLPVSGVPSGNYVVRVQALDSSDRVLVESSELKVDYRAPGALAKLVASLQGSTIAVVGFCGLGLVAVVGLGALAVFLIPRGRGMRNVELALPEKARRPPRPAEPAAPPAAPAAPLAAPPAPQPAAPPAPARPAAVQAAAPSAAPAAAQAVHAPARPSAPPAPPAQAQPAAAPAPAGVLAVVSVAEPVIVRFQAEIRKSPFRIGRAADNDGVLPVDATSGVSGHHCVISVDRGRWTVQDDASKFGTTVNGQPVPKGQPLSLEDGAVLGLGPKLKIRFQIAPGSSHGAPS